METSNQTFLYTTVTLSRTGNISGRYKSNVLWKTVANCVFGVEDGELGKGLREKL